MPRIRGVAQLQYPALAASVPTAATWSGQDISFTCTLSNSATTCTAIVVTSPTQFASTGNFVVGQPITGPGITAGTTVSAIVSATAITLSQNTTASAAGTLIGCAVSGTNPSQSSSQNTQGAWGGYPTPPITADVPGCLIEVPNTITTFAGTFFVIPPGDGFMVVTSGSTAAVYQVFLGTTSPSWTTVFTCTVSAANYIPFISDGFNFRVSTPTTAGSIVIYQWR